MRQPIEVGKNLTLEQALRWDKQFVKTGRSAAEFTDGWLKTFGTKI